MNKPTTDTLPAEAVPAELIRLGHYELLDCIGRGGMGLVYRARDTRLDRQVAIKCLRTELFEAHYVERFKREALLLAKLNHPNIVQIYDFIEAPEQLALVMELVEGQNLQLHLREHIVPFAQRMRWLTEIAQGLAVAHDAGIIHRDLKAENILINQRKVAKITDLGIAKSQDFNATLTDHIAGSYCSMSPEQAMGEQLDFKSDLFSFGILAYQLLCGAHPFGDTNNKLQLMQRIISHPPTAPGKHNPNLPAGINELLGQLLSKDPAKRPDNTHWVAAQLETLSHWQPANDFASDDTQALIPNSTAANQSNLKSTGIASAVRTQDHPTFETRFVAINTVPKKSRWLPIKNYLIENKISVGFGLFSVLIFAAVVVWQLQPKPPKYVAVIPPKLTAEGMQESQQELVKGAVYDAIQQSVIQLDGYYLIPRDEIADVNGDNDTVQKATAADELITTLIDCKVDACSITLFRLIPDNSRIDSKLRVDDTIMAHALTDNYASIFSLISDSIKTSFNSKIARKIKVSDENTYRAYLDITKEYLHNGASVKLSEKLEEQKENFYEISGFEELYRNITLDLFYETGEKSYLTQLEEALIFSNEKSHKSRAHLENLFYFYLAENKFDSAEKTLRIIFKSHPNSIQELSLNAYMALVKNDLEAAKNAYEKLVRLRKTSENYYNLALTYWHIGKSEKSKENLYKAIALAPKDFKSHRLLGAIAINSGEIKQALISFEIALEKQPDDVTSLNNLGLAHMLSGDNEQALTLFQKASNIAPNSTSVLLNLADIQNIMKSHRESEANYKRIIALSSNDKSRDALRNISQSYAHIGDFSAALQAIKELQKIDPDSIDTSYSSALISALAEEKTSAIIYMGKSLSQGISIVWFDLPWFDLLCEKTQFIDLMKAHGNNTRCIP